MAYHLNPEERRRLVNKLIQEGQNIYQISKECGISRPTIYKWIKEYRKNNINGKEFNFEGKKRQIKNYPKQASKEQEQLVLNEVRINPLASKYQIALHLSQKEPEKALGPSGVYKVLLRNGLNLVENREQYAAPSIREEIITTPKPGIVGQIKSVWEQFIPSLAPAPPPAFNTIIKYFSVSLFSSFTFFIVFGSWFKMVFSSETFSGILGLGFASMALLMGSFFFLYSLKYYLTLAIVLSFSQQEGEKGSKRLIGRKGIISMILGLGKGNEQETGGGPVGLEPNLDHITLKRHPYISIHIPFYNEKNVAERLLKASTSFEYPGEYEVIICDDSNDETTKIVREYQQKHTIKGESLKVVKNTEEGWELSEVEVRPGVTLKHLHRTSRSGFKGGALRVALRLVDPRTEFISVFDADFVPYPDTLTLFLKYFKLQNNLDEDYTKSNVAAVQGYQWHVLNKSENWITRGVRSEYAGSYVIERSGTEIYGGLKQISGSVYMIRKDVLQEVGWETSITEDFELTLKLYNAGYKVVYTPYIQAPAECVSTLKRLIRQRMRWAEGHSHNIKKMFGKLMLNPKLTVSEKLEFLYLTPYYLQAFFFLVGTFSWLLSETVFKTHLPFWTSLWGWSLVLTNMLALPLMNAVGLFLEESEEKDYGGIAAFIVLSYIVVPFQAYAALKGFLEQAEGPWFRTPKTGRITDIFSRGRFYRFISGILPGKSPSVAQSLSKAEASFPLDYNPYLTLSSANNRFNTFNIKSKKNRRWIGKTLLSVFLLVSTIITSYAPFIPTASKEETPSAGSGVIVPAKQKRSFNFNSPLVKEAEAAFNNDSESPVKTGFDLTSKKLIVKGDKKDFSLAESPSFAIDEKRSLLTRIYALLLKVIGKKEKSIIDRLGLTVEVVNAKNEKVSGVSLKEEADGSLSISLSNSPLAPGEYTLSVKSKDGTISQDFSWGVLALNTNKSIYLPDEKAKISFGVLDSEGDTVCTANLTLLVRNLSESTQEELSSENGRLRVNPTCGTRDMVLTPDYEALYQVKGPGKYEMTLLAKTFEGQYSITDSFEVRSQVAFDVERTTVTRVYPQNIYPVIFTIKANEDYQGILSEEISRDFIISELSKADLKKYRPELSEYLPSGVNEYLGEKIAGDKKYLEWLVNFEKGKVYTFGYQYDSPDSSPDFYLLGPLRIGDFKEVRFWQLAIDADTVIFLTTASSSPWTIPVNWNDSANTIRAIGGGGGGGSYTVGAGGGAGGDYAHVTSLDLNYGNTAAFGVGTGGSAEIAGGNTWFNASTYANCTVVTTCVSAAGGARGLDAAAGAQGTSGGIGSTAYAGGGGGAGSGVDTDSSGGGGGAGSPIAIGGTGGGADTATTGQEANGGGGAAGNTGTADNGVQGGINGGDGGDSQYASGGTGGVSADGGAGSRGSGGGGGDSGYNGGQGGDGDDWTTNPGGTSGGPGGGGGGGDDDSSKLGGNGGAYGGGGGGGSTGGTAGNGLIVITYTPLLKVSGYIRLSDESTADTTENTTVVKVIVEGGSTYSPTINATGYFEQYVYVPASGNAILVYVDDAGDFEASAVTVSDGTSDMSIDLYEDRLIVRSDKAATSLTLQDMTDVNSADADDLISSVSTSALTVNSGKELHVFTGKTFAPEGTITTQGSGNMHIDDAATATLGTSGNTIDGDLLVDDTALINLNNSTTINGGDITVLSGGDVASSAGTVTMGAGGTIGGGSTGSTFQLTNLTVSSGTTTLGADADNVLVFNGDISISSGATLAMGGKTADVNGGDVTTTGSVTAISCSSCTSGGLTLSSAGTLGGGTGAITMYALTLDGSSATTTAASALTVMNNVTVGTDRTLAMGTYNLTAGNSGVTNSGGIAVTGTVTQSLSSAPIAKNMDTQLKNSAASGNTTSASSSWTVVDASTLNANSAIEQQIEIIDQEKSTTSIDYGPTDNSLGLMRYDSSKYTGPQIYLEAVMKRSGGTEDDVGAKHSIDCSNGADDCKIAYWDQSGGHTIRFFDCDDVNCSTGTLSIVDGTADCTLTGCQTNGSGENASLDCSNGSDDCKIAFYNNSVSAMYFADCDNSACSTGTVTLLDGYTSCVLTNCVEADTTPGYMISMDCSQGGTDCKIGYYEVINRDLFFADCDNATCSSGTATLLDGNTGCVLTSGDGCSTSADRGGFIWLDCSPGATDCKMTYRDVTTGDLMFGDCANATCSSTSGTVTLLDGNTGCSLTDGTGCSTGDSVGAYASLDCSQGAGDCKIAYYHSTDQDLYFADCDAVDCSSGSTNLVDGTSPGCLLTNCRDGTNIGKWIDIDCTKGAGDCKISYKDTTNLGQYFADCDNATCSTGTISLLDGEASCLLTNCQSGNDMGIYSSIDCDAGATDCKIAAYDNTNKDLVFYDCDNAACSTGTRTNADQGTDYAQVELYTGGGTPVGAAVHTSGTSYTRVRKEVPISLTTATDYGIRIRSSEATNTTAYVKSARLIIVQSGTAITDTEAQIEVGNYQTSFSNTSYATLTDHPIYYYDSTKFSATVTAYFEATIHTQSSGNTVYAQLLQCTSVSNCSTGSAVTNSQVSNTGNTNWTRVRSSSITLTSGNNYAVQVNMSAGSGDIANAKIVLDQTQSPSITSTELLQKQVNTLATDTNDGYSDTDFLNQFNPYALNGATFQYFFESSLKTSAGTGYAQLYNDTDSSAITSSEVSTANTTYTRTRSSDITANMPTLAGKSATTTVQSSSSGSATVGGSGSTQFYNLDIGPSVSDSRTYTITLGGNITVSGTLTLQNAGSTYTHTLGASSYIITLLGTGTPFVVDSNAAFTESSSTVNYTGDGAVTVTAETYWNLQVGNATTQTAARTYTLGPSTLTISNDLTIGPSSGSYTHISDANANEVRVDVNRDFIIQSNGSYSASSYTTNYLSVYRDFTNNGTFTHRSGKVVLDGAADTTQVVDGSTTFYELSATTGDRTIKFGAGDTFVIDTSGTFTATGDSCLALVVIRSTTAGTQVNITKTGTITPTYVDLQDINFSSSVTATTSIDSGNNTNISITANSCIGASTDSSNTATGYSFQRKTFHDGTNYWLFYHDGDQIEIRYSSDGATWNNPSTAASGHIAYDTNDFSCWYASIGGTKYFWLTVAVPSGTNQYDILVRRGTLSSNDITWDTEANVVAFNGSTASDVYSYPYISLDSSNYMWVIARYYDGDNYVAKAVRSDVNDTGDATWATIGFGTTKTATQISNNQADTNVFGNIVPLTSQDMYAVFTVNTEILGCTWDDSYDSGNGAWLDADNNSCANEASVNYYSNNQGADYLTSDSNNGVKEASTTLGSATQTQTLDGAGDTFYTLTDNMNKKWTSDRALTTSTTGEKRNLDMATDSSGNTVAVWQDMRNADSVNGTFTATGYLITNRERHKSVLLPDGKVLVMAGYNGGTTAELFDPSTGTFSATSGGLTAGVGQFAATLLPSGKVLIVGGENQSLAELYNPQTRTFTNTTGYLSTMRANATVTLLPNGQVLVAGGTSGGSNLSTAELFDPSSNTFLTTGNLNSTRVDHTATLLPNGKVLITGGTSSGTKLSTAELFDPATQAFTITAGSLNTSRTVHAATLLPNGKVLIAGGIQSSALTSAELFDPATNIFSNSTGGLNVAREGLTATLLPNGKVLFIGGKSYLSAAELYDPSIGTFSAASGGLNTGRHYHTATLLPNGKVLIAGGLATGDAYLSSAELYTPKTFDIYAQKYDSDGTAQWNGGADIKVNSDDGSRTDQTGNPSLYDHLNPKVKLDTNGDAVVVWQETRNNVYGDDIYSQKLNGSDGAKEWPSTTTQSFTTTGTMAFNRYQQTATLLPNGKVLVVGSFATTDGQSIAELYDPSTQTFTTTGTMIFPRFRQTVTPLPNGKILIVGSGWGNNGKSIAELYDPSTQAFTTTGTTSFNRDINTATLLPNGKVLIAGSFTGNGQSIAELYDPSTQAFTTLGIMAFKRYQHTATLLPNDNVLVVGNVVTNDGRTVAELFNPSTQAFTTTGTMTYNRALHTATLLPNGKVLVVGTSQGNAGQSIAELYDPATQAFTTTGTMSFNRYSHTATLLPNGKVLVAGSAVANNGQSIAELYDPATQAFTTTGIMAFNRKNHTSTLLPNGKVLVVGSSVANNGQSIAELYTPQTDIRVSNDGSATNWIGGASLEYPDSVRGIVGRQNKPVLTLDTSNNAVVAWEDDRLQALQNWGLFQTYDSTNWYKVNNNIAAIGGCNGGGGFSSCGSISSILGQPYRIMGQKLSTSDGAKNWGDDVDSQNKNNPEDIYLSATGDTSQNPSLASEGTNTILTWDSNGATKNESGALKQESNIYTQKLDSTGSPLWGQSFATTGASTYKRDEHSTTLLPNGKVLVVGSDESDNGQSIAELYDPATQVFTTTGTMAFNRNEHVSILLPNGKVLITGNSFDNNGQSIAELYDPATQVFTTTGTSVFNRSVHSASLLPNGKVLIVGTGEANNGQSIAELYDPSTQAFSTTGTTAFNRSYFTTTLLPSGKVLILGAGGVNGGRSIAELYDPTTQAFTTTGATIYQRYYHTATLLTNGKVLVVGSGTSFGVSVAELYDPATQTFTTTGITNYTRKEHTATLLPNGKVLVIGTTLSNGGYSVAELYDPSTQIFTTSGISRYSRISSVPTLLPNGKVLVVGSGATLNAGQTVAELYSIDQMVNTGADLADQTNPTVAVNGTGTSAELFYAWEGRNGSGSGGSFNGDSERGGGSYKIFGQKIDNPSSGTLTNQWPSGTTGAFTTTGTSALNRYSHTATLLPNSKVLIVGTLAVSTGRSIAELYDPATQAFTTTGKTAFWRYTHTSTLLPNGNVLIVGTQAGDNGRSIAELYNPATQAFTTTGTTAFNRYCHTSTLLPNGKVLVVGTAQSNNGQSIAELYDPATQAFTTTGTLAFNRGYHTATLLPNGKVLIVGTWASNNGQSIAELYNPATQAFTTTGTMAFNRYYHTSTLLPNGKVLIVGTALTNNGQSVAELYDPATQAFTTTGTLAFNRDRHASTLLPNGNVLIVGTLISNNGQSIAELYNPATQAFTTTGTMAFNRYYQTSNLLPNGKVLIVGTAFTNNGQSIAELYNPIGERLMSHDFALSGDQRYPQIVANSGSPIVVWQDNRSFIGNTITNDWNIFMQRFDGTTGEPLWPAKSTTSPYTSPYAVLDIRVDTFAGGTGTHYSGKPAVGGVTGTLGDGTARIVIGYEDNRSDTNAASGECGYSNTGTQVRVCGQSININETNVNQTNNWNVKFYASAAATLTVYTDITEWDGTLVAGSSASQTWNSCDPSCPSLQTITFSTGGTSPPSVVVGNTTMRRYRSRLVWSSGTVTVSYDNTGYKSRLELEAAAALNDDIDTSVPTGVSKNFSVVSNSGNVYLAYIDGTSSVDQVSYKKRTGTSWSGATRIDASEAPDDNYDSYVSLTFDTDTDVGDLYVFWVDTNNSHIYYKQYDASAVSWLSVTDWKTSGTNTNITSNYGGPGVFAEWTVGSASPYHINFGVVLVPERLWLIFALGPLIPAFSKNKKKFKDFLARLTTRFKSCLLMLFAVPYRKFH